LPFQFQNHEDYVEVRLEGVIEGPLPIPEAAMPPEGPLKRLLIDFTDVTEVIADTYRLAEQAKRNEALGLKVAVYAPRPALFGLNRQVLQLGLVHEGVSASVFTSIDEAIAWLRTG